MTHDEDPGPRHRNACPVLADDGECMGCEHMNALGLPDLDLSPEEANLVGRLREIGKQERALKEDADALKAQLRSIGRTGRLSFLGKPVLDLTPGQAFDEELARALLPAATLEKLRSDRLDAKKAQDLLPPTLYAMCCRPKAVAVKPL